MLQMPVSPGDEYRTRLAARQAVHDTLSRRDARFSVRLAPEDRILLSGRAAARRMPSATYVSVLVRLHLRNLTPLPPIAACSGMRIGPCLAAARRRLRAPAGAVDDIDLQLLEFGDALVDALVPYAGHRRPVFLRQWESVWQGGQLCRDLL